MSRGNHMRGQRICQKCDKWTYGTICEDCKKYSLYDDVGTMEVGTKQECFARLHSWLKSEEAKVLYTAKQRKKCKELTELNGDNESLGFTLSECETTIEDL